MARIKDSSPGDDSQRVDGYLEGDAGAFDEIDRWIRGELGRRYGSLRGDLDDLCQSVHGKLVANLRGGKFLRQSSLRTYVYRITHLTAIDGLRARYAERAFTQTLEPRPATAADNPYHSVEALERSQLLHQVVQTQPASCRELWSLVFVERLSYDEIGERLGIPPGTVKSRMWYCRQKAMATMRRLQARGPSKTSASTPRPEEHP